MSVDSRSLPAYFSTDADFRSWCQGIAAQLVAAGLVKTADTGQVDNTTVSKPSGANTAMGYEIYRFSDTIQATVPIFIKVEYGGGTAAVDPSLWITTGPSTNGAGSITGAATTRVQLKPYQSKSAGNTLPSYCSGDGSRVALCTHYDSTSSRYPVFFTIDRLRDAANTATNDGWTLASMSGGVFGGSASWTQSVIGNVAQTGLASAAFPGVSVSSTVNAGTGARSYNNNISCMPAIVLAGQLRYLSTLVFYRSSDIAGVAPTTVTVNNLGAAHTYMLIPGLAQGTFMTQGQLDDAMMLWE